MKGGGSSFLVWNQFLDARRNFARYPDDVVDELPADVHRALVLAGVSFAMRDPVRAIVRAVCRACAAGIGKLCIEAVRADSRAIAKRRVTARGLRCRRDRTGSPALVPHLPRRSAVRDRSGSAHRSPLAQEIRFSAARCERGYRAPPNASLSPIKGIRFVASMPCTKDPSLRRPRLYSSTL